MYDESPRPEPVTPAKPLPAAACHGCGKTIHTSKARMPGYCAFCMSLADEYGDVPTPTGSGVRPGVRNPVGRWAA